jgi:anti-anti-sigma regulatory factor
MTALDTAPTSPLDLLTEVVDTRAGVVRASGVLTRSGADLLCGTVETLERLGHRRITLDLTAVHAADDDGLAQLEELRTAMGAGQRPGLVVRRPTWRLG